MKGRGSGVNYSEYSKIEKLGVKSIIAQNFDTPKKGFSVGKAGQKPSPKNRSLFSNCIGKMKTLTFKKNTKRSFTFN